MMVKKKENYTSHEFGGVSESFAVFEIALNKEKKDVGIMCRYRNHFLEEIDDFLSILLPAFKENHIYSKVVRACSGQGCKITYYSTKVKKYFEFFLSPFQQGHCLCFCEDVTSLNEKLESFLFQSERGQKAVKMLDAYIFDYDVVNDKLFFSKDYEEFMLPHSLVEARSKLAEEGLVHPADLPTIDKMIGSLQDGDESFSGLIRIKSRQEQYHWFRILLSALQYENGRPNWVIGVIRDIDERNLSEAGDELNDSDNSQGFFSPSATERKIMAVLQKSGQGKNHVMIMLEIELTNDSETDELPDAFQDAVMIQSSAHIRSMFRKEDIIGKIDHNHYVVFLQNYQNLATLPKKAEEVLRKTRDSYKYLGSTVLSANIGMSIYPEAGVRIADLWEHTEAALQIARKKGKNEYHIFENSFIRTQFDVNKGMMTLAAEKSVNFRSDLRDYVFKILYTNKNIDLSIRSVMALFGNHYHVSRTYIFETSDDGIYMKNTYEWCADGEHSYLQEFQNFYTKDFAEYISNFGQTNIFYIPNMKQAPPKIQAMFAPYQATSVLQFAIREEGKLKGYIGLTNHTKTMSFKKPDIDDLETLCGLIGTFLRGYRSRQLSQKNFHSLCSLIDNFHTGSYVINRDDYSLVFINQAMKAVFPNVELGDICYQVMRGLGEPCGDCPLRKLDTTSEHTTTRSQIYNERLRAWMDVTATPIHWSNWIQTILIQFNELARSNLANIPGEVPDQAKQAFEYEYYRPDSGTENYHAIMEQTDVMVFEWKPKYQQRYLSPALVSELTGCYDGRGLFQIWIDDGVVYPEDVPLVEDLQRSIYSGQGDTNVSVRLKHKRRRFVWYKVVVTCYYDKRGKLEHLVGILTDVDDTVRLQKELKYKEEYDILTGIYNSKGFYSRVQRMVQENSNTDYAIIRIDIDRFKFINDIYGLEEGDNILRYIAGILYDTADIGSAYCRLGDDIFCVCIPFEEKVEINHFITDIKGKIVSYPLGYHITPYFGVCIIDGLNTPISLLCDRAGLALKTIKGSTDKNWAFYDNKLRSVQLQEKIVENEMEEALSNHQFEIYLQPKYELRSSRIIGAEALVRWNHPVRGVLTPDQFVPLFEKNGFITKLDEYIWEAACHFIRQWMDEGHDPIPFSVNVSHRHIQNTGLQKTLAALVEKYQLPAGLMELELTEAAFFQNKEEISMMIRSLKKHGILFAMDDFGSGYSALNLLEKIPVDTIKLDNEFLSMSTTTKKGKIVMTGIISVLNHLNINIVAEGIETKTQADFLLESGCEYGQGYYFSPPVPIEEFEKMLCDRNDF